MPRSVLFFGSDEFSVACCSHLLAARNAARAVASLEVVTPPDCKRTRIPQVPLTRFATENGLKLHQAPPKSLAGWQPVEPFVFYKDLHDRLAVLGADELLKTIEDIDQGTVNGILQDGAEATRAPKIDRSMTIIRWSEMTAEQVFRLHRALGYKIPLTTTFRGKRTQLLSLENPLLPEHQPPSDLAAAASSAPPGSLRFHRASGTLFARCADLSWIRASALRVEGKRELGPVDFANGYQLASGEPPAATATLYAFDQLPPSILKL
ncbi:hypothetical protein HK405_006791 [Cladochytrium tenue]|nr:hypothetical protein HK405_006791 [Cladochytrium tenue]